MKKLLLTISAFAVGALLLAPFSQSEQSATAPAPTPAAPPAAVPAAPPAAAPAKPVEAGQVKFLEITIGSLKVWPVKTNDRCWDAGCFLKMKLPPRGAANYDQYFEDKNFKKACSGKQAPDPFVEIQIGPYERFATHKIDNSCNPVFNIKHVFRVPAQAAFTVTVYDNDGAAGVQMKKDLMGTWTANNVPAELMNGGTLTLKSFGQIEELVLSARVVERPVAAAATCDGVYKVRIGEFEVHETKENGAPWDRGIGKGKLPDVLITFKIGDATVTAPVKDNTLAFNFTEGGSTITIKKNMIATLKVLDKDMGSNETIGETAVPDVCSLLTAEGAYTFKDFGRVKKVVVIFEKIQ